MKTWIQWLLAAILVATVTGVGCGSDDQGAEGDDNGASLRAELEAVGFWAVQKHIFTLDLLALVSADYTVPFFEAPTPTEAQIDQLYHDFFVLLNSASMVADELAALQAHGQPATPGAEPQDFASAYFGFVDSLEQVGVRSRQRVLQTYETLADTEKQEAFELVPPAFVSEHGISGPADLETKLQSGELDGKAGQIYSALYHNHPSFQTAAQNQGQNIGTIVERDIGNAIEAGGALLVESAGKVSPAIAKGLEFSEKALELENRVTALYQDPHGALKQEVEAAFVAAVEGYVDVDGPVDAVALGERVSTAVKAVTDATVGWGDFDAVAAVAGKASVHVVDTAGQADVVWAERSDVPAGGEPESVLCALDPPGSGQLLLPPGTWTIWLSSDGGDSKSVQVTVAPGQSLTITASTSGQGGTGGSGTGGSGAGGSGGGGGGGECTALCACVAQEETQFPQETQATCMDHCAAAQQGLLPPPNDRQACETQFWGADYPACFDLCSAYPG